MENLGFDQDEPSISVVTHQRDAIPRRTNPVRPKNWRMKLHEIWTNYQWRMRHYFYIHLALFFFNTLLSGLIVWSIEQGEVPYIDCWFMGATCVFTCGLQTYAFNLFSRASQIILLIFTLVSGITVSTIPAIFIKIYRLKREINEANEESSSISMRGGNTLPIRQFIRQDSFDSIRIQDRLQSLPTPQHLRVRSHLLLIVLILSTCFIIYLSSFLAMGIWLKYHYNPEDLTQGNTTIDPFYAALVITITSFNQNGLSVWANGITLFVDDVFMNIVIMIVVMSGTSLFPAILRGVVNLVKYFSPWKYKIFFDYILLNNHRLSTVIYPSVQTRLYVTTTILMQILGVSVALILDFDNPNLANFGGGERFMIFMFQTVNTRFGGYATINISALSTATLLIFILLMAIKPQMLCAINETPFEMEWILLQTQQKLDQNSSDGNRRQSIEIFLPVNRMKNYLVRQGSLTKAEAKTYFASLLRTDRAEAAINELNERRNQSRLSMSHSENTANSVHISLLRTKLLMITFCRHVILSLFSLFTATRTWLFIFIFLICVFESERVVPNNPTITVLLVVFEVISAFGGCGLSIGFSATAPSLAAVLNTACKISLILVMCMGRHRGLLDSMKDQEEIEYSAQTLIDSWRQIALHEKQQKRTKMRKDFPTESIHSVNLTPPISTRF